jgi:hypothetical protein
MGTEGKRFVKRVGGALAGSALLGLMFPLSLFFPGRELPPDLTCAQSPALAFGVACFYISCIGFFSVTCTRLGGAVTLMTSYVFFSLYVGTVFFAGSLVELLCSEQPAPWFVIALVCASVPIIGVLAFVTHGREKLRQVVAINPVAFDLENGYMSAAARLRRPDGRVTPATSSLVGLGLIAAAAGSWLAPDVRTGVFIVLGWLLGVALLGIVPIYQIYLTWLITRRDKKRGRRMLVREFHG